MQSHDDSSHDEERKEFLEVLEKRANKMRSQKESTIASGFQKESTIASGFVSQEKVGVIWLPPDPHNILRISCGGGVDFLQMDYCSFRGDIARCIEQLEKSIRALKIFENELHRQKNKAET